MFDAHDHTSLATALDTYLTGLEIHGADRERSNSFCYMREKLARIMALDVRQKGGESPAHAIADAYSKSDPVLVALYKKESGIALTPNEESALNTQIAFLKVSNVEAVKTASTVQGLITQVQRN